MTAQQAIENERSERMKPYAPWFTGEPVIRLPLKAVLVDAERNTAYVTLQDIASALED